MYYQIKIVDKNGIFVRHFNCKTKKHARQSYRRNRNKYPTCKVTIEEIFEEVSNESKI